MEKKVAGQTVETPGREAASGWRRYGLALAALAVAGAALSGAWAWREHRRQERIFAAVPAAPDLRGRPAKLGQAVAEAEALIRTGGRRIEGLEELARIYHANNLRTEAEACWRLLHQLQPQEAHWTYYLADLRRTASDYVEMTALLRETVAAAPDYAPAWLQLAEQAFKSGDTAAAERYYRRRLELVPGDPYARLGLARVALQEGRREEARQAIESIVHDVPAFPSSHNLLAEMLAAEGDAEGAQRERLLGKNAGRFREADDPWLSELHLRCYDPKRLFVLGTIEYQLARGDRGLSYFQRAVDLAPEDPVGYEMLGDLYLKIGQAAKARDTLEHYLQIAGPARPTAVASVLLSQAYRDLHQPAEALRVAERALEREPQAPDLHNTKGVALADLKRHEEAVVAFREELALNPNDPPANFNLGVSLLTLGRVAEAVKSMQHALVGRPRFPEALSLLGEIEMDSGRLDEAERYLRPLLEANPDVPRAKQLMAVWHLQSGRAAEKTGATADAERHYQAGLALLPEEPELNASLGSLCLTQGRFGDALKPLQLLQRARPDDPQAALFLGQTYAALGQREEARRLLTRGAVLAEKAGRKDTAAYCREILQQL